MQEQMLNRVYDWETGTELSESQLAALEIYEQEILEQGSAIEALRPLPGYALIEQFCLDQIDAAKDKLLDAKDLDDIRRLQSIGVAFSNLLGSIDSLVREADRIKENRNGPSSP
jgi:hypothetical protein